MCIRDRCNNGGSENTATNHTYTLAGYWGSEDTFGINYICNVSGKEKLSIMFAVARGTATAGYAPNRREAVGKFTETTGQITDIEGFNEQAGSFDTNTNLTVLGSDITPADAITFPTNVQTGSRAEITDSRKMYNLSALTFDDDFSTDKGWVSSGVQAKIDSSGYLLFDDDSDGSAHKIYYDIGNTLSLSLIHI